MKHLQPIEISQVSVFNSTRAVGELFWKLQHLSFVMKLERRDDSPSGENAGTEFTLSWHEDNLADAMSRAWEEKRFLDVTLASGDGTIGAHRLVLCAHSEFLENLLTSSTSHPNPMVYLNDIDFEDLVALVEFMYRGSMTVTHEALPGIINGAKILKIRGLSREMEELVEPPESSGSSEPPVVDREKLE